MIRRISTILLRELRVNLNYRAAVGRRRARRPTGDKHSPHRGPAVGIVRLDLIGDFVLFTAALQQFRRIYSDSRLVLIGHSSWQDLAQWLNDHGILSKPGALFDEFIAVQPDGLVSLSYFLSQSERLAALDLLVNTAYSRANVVDKLIAASGVEAVGWDGDTINIIALQKRLNDRRYRRLIPAMPAAPEYVRNHALVQSLAEGAAPACATPEWRIPDTVRDEALQELCERHPTLLSTPFIAVSPFASLAVKQWPLKNYGALMNRLLESHPDLRVAVLGAARNAAEGARLLNAIRFPNRAHNLVGQTSLIETTCLLARADLSISGDTAAAHLASATGTSAVAIMGGGHYERFFPYPAPHAGARNKAVAHPMPCFQCNWFCRYPLAKSGEPRCLAAVNVDDVLREVNAALL